MDVEQVVREVIAELMRREGQCAESNSGSSSSRARASTHPTEGERSPAQNGGSRELVVSSRVVSLAEIGDRLAQIRRLVVPAGAVITPAAREALADRGVEVVLGDARQSATAAGARLLVVAARTKFNVDPLVSALTDEGIAVEAKSSDCLIRTADELAVTLRDDTTLVIVLTHDVAAAMCLANRLAGVRAVSASSPAEAVESARAVGANVLVLDPRGKGVYLLKQTISAFGRSGPRTCPAALRSRLE